LLHSCLKSVKVASRYFDHQQWLETYKLFVVLLNDGVSMCVSTNIFEHAKNWVDKNLVTRQINQYYQLPIGSYTQDRSSK